jgi:hypothetical protein
MFDDSQFPVDDRDVYRLRILLPGAVRASRLRVAFVVVARNCDDTFDVFKEHLLATAALFKNYAVYVTVGYSEDLTPDRFEEWAEADQRVRVRDAQSEHWQSRRKQYQETREMIDWKPDVVIVVDPGLAGGWSINGVRDTMAYWDLFDCMSANGVDSNGKYVDVESFRLNDWKPMNCLRVHNVISHLPCALPLPVYSAFGGLAIYRGPAYLDLRVEYWFDGCTSENPHFSLHEWMREYGYKRHFLNPTMMACYDPPECTLEQAVAVQEVLERDVKDLLNQMILDDIAALPPFTPAHFDYYADGLPNDETD